MKLLLDMNLSRLWIPVLRSAGFEAVHWSEIGTAVSPDPEIMAHAKLHGYPVCTQDLDFGLMLAATGDGSPSVLQIRARDGMGTRRTCSYEVRCARTSGDYYSYRQATYEC